MAEKTTREKVRDLVAAEPTLNMTDIAARLGKSRERIRQIVEMEGLNIPRGIVGIRQRREPSSPAPRVITGGVPVKITHTAAGLIGELLVAADLTARGFTVFFPLNRSAICDLIALAPDGRVQKIEVRCANRRGGTLLFNRSRDTDRHDRYAIVVTGEPVTYRPEF